MRGKCFVKFISAAKLRGNNNLCVKYGYTIIKKIRCEEVTRKSSPLGPNEQAICPEESTVKG